MSTFKRIAPIFAVRDLRAAMAHYTRLGFSTRDYEGGGYGFATRDGIEIHLGVVSGKDRRIGSAYLFVDDADELCATGVQRASMSMRQKTPSGDSTKEPLSTLTAT